MSNGQSTYFVRRQHDGVRMSRDGKSDSEWIDMENAIFFANRCVAGSMNTESYEVVRTKDDIIVAIVNEDHSVGLST